MIKTKYKEWQVIFNGDQRLYGLMDNIIAGNDIPIEKEVKNTARSRVLLLNHAGKKIILKSPREKNKRKWIRFTTLYRKGEAFKTIDNMDKLEHLGIESNKPLLAMEKRRFGMVVDSWMIYEYLPGEVCREKDYPDVVKKLKEIHAKHILHGDAQIENFLNSESHIITIDFSPKKALFGNVSRFYEYFYLQRSAPGIQEFFDLPDHALAYRIAQAYSRLYWSWRDFKKKRRTQRNHISKILVIRLSSIGDIILTTPVLRALKRKYPDAVIHYLAMDTFKDAISGNPDVDKLILFEKRKFPGVSGICRFSRTLKDTHYDLIVDLHAKIRSRLITLFVTGKVLRYKKRVLWKSILVPLRLRRYQVDDTIVRNYFKPLEKLFVYFTGETLTFHFGPQDLEKIQPYKNAVVIAPGAANNTKQWPAANFASLGNMINDRIVLIGGKNDHETCEQIRKTIGSHCENLAGKLSLKESGALVSVSKYVISNDSGPFHIARGTAKKVFVIFGPTDPNMFTYDENAVLIYAGTPCSPCSLHGDKACPRGHFDCMKSLTPEMVYEIIKNPSSPI